MAKNFEYVPEYANEEGYIEGGYSRWDCDNCGNEIRRYRGCGDQQCECGQWYNASGQKLRNDWMNNYSNYDDDVSDMDGFEESQLRNEDW